jgi:hypothetical protein
MLAPTLKKICGEVRAYSCGEVRAYSQTLPPRQRFRRGPRSVTSPGGASDNLTVADPWGADLSPIGERLRRAANWFRSGTSFEPEACFAFAGDRE